MSSSILVVVAILGAGDLPDTAAVAPAEVAARIDRLVQGTLESGMIALPPCNDTEYLRRASLDLVGRVPPVRSVRGFLADKSSSAEKRAKAVVRLLESPEFAGFQASQWTEYLTERRPFSQESFDGRLLQRSIRDAIQENHSYAEIVAELLTAEGPGDANGPVNFLLRYNAEPVDLAGAVSRKFLGLTLQCAECHDHPHARWGRDDFWGLAAYFGRLRRMQSAGGRFAEGENFFAVVERPRGELRVPDRYGAPDNDASVTKKTVFPRLPGAKAIDHATDRRAAFAKWLTDPANPYFARHAVNRTWLQLFGRPLVATLEPTDQTPASKLAPVLDLLAEDFARNRFDLKRLFTVILLSETYQRSAGSLTEAATPKPEDGAPQSLLAARQREHYARATLRALSADQIYHSLGSGLGYRGDEPDAQVAAMTADDFTYDQPVDFFSKASLSAPRALALLNGEHVRGAAGRGADTVLRLYGNDVGRDHIEWLYLATVTRVPSDEEVQTMLDLAELQAEPKAGLEDVVWVLLNSAEFQTNH